jgi:hypothetical protein
MEDANLIPQFSKTKDTKMFLEDQPVPYKQLWELNPYLSPSMPATGHSIKAEFSLTVEPTSTTESWLPDILVHIG